MVIKSKNLILDDWHAFLNDVHRFFGINAPGAGYLITKWLSLFLFTVPFLVLVLTQLIYSVVSDSIIVVIELVLSHGFLTLFAMLLQVFLVAMPRKMIDAIFSAVKLLFFLPEKLFAN